MKPTQPNTTAERTDVVWSTPPEPTLRGPTASEVLTADEACRFLRLDSDHVDMAAAVKCLYRLCKDRGLKPLRIGRSFKFTIAELRRFAAAETDAIRSTPDSSQSPESEPQSDGKGL